MKAFPLLLLWACCLAAQAQPPTLRPGSAAPQISLPDIDGKTVSFTDYPLAKGFIIVFTGNTCPYSKAYEGRIAALHKKYAPLHFPLIAINPNDARTSPGDSFEKMKARARAGHFSFPYLYDENQSITAQYGPHATPYIFIVEKTTSGNIIRYTGAIDDDTPGTNADKIKFAENALNALLRHALPAITTTKAIGCSVHWKQDPGM